MLALSLAATVVTTAVVSIGLTACAGPLTDALEADRLRPYVWTVPLGVFLLGTHHALSTFAVRQRAFARVGGAKAAEGAGKAIAQLGLHAVGTVGLLLADLAARTLGVLVLARRCGLSRLRSASLTSVRRVAKRYRDFPLFGGPAALLQRGRRAVPCPCSSPRCTGSTWPDCSPWASEWSPCRPRWSARPRSQVYLGEGARLAREDPAELQRMFVRTTKRLVLLGAVPLLLVALAAPALFGFVFGDSWVEAGHYVRILAATFAIQFVVVPLSQTLTILERQRWQLAWDATRLALVAGANLRRRRARAAPPVPPSPRSRSRPGSPTWRSTVSALWRCEVGTVHGAGSGMVAPIAGRKRARLLAL